MAMSSSLSKMCSLNEILLPPIGIMLMLSVPAAIITSASPRRTRSAAIDTACSPDEQKRFTVTPATVFGQAGEQQRDARDVHPLLRFRDRAARDHVVDRLGIERRYFRERRLQHVRQQIVRADVAEHAARRFAYRRARRGDDVCVLYLLGHLNSFNPV